MSLFTPSQACTANAYNGNRIQTNACHVENNGIELIKPEMILTTHNVKASLNQVCFIHSHSFRIKLLIKNKILIIESHKSDGSLSIKRIKGPKNQNIKLYLSKLLSLLIIFLEFFQLL
tara:strand:- start:239 stop:592 length:354 start_codon:yes stop_codon:yes gene_type:complete